MQDTLFNSLALTFLADLDNKFLSSNQLDKLIQNQSTILSYGSGLPWFALLGALSPLLFHNLLGPTQLPHVPAGNNTYANCIAGLRGGNFAHHEGPLLGMQFLFQGLILKTSRLVTQAIKDPGSWRVGRRILCIRDHVTLLHTEAVGDRKERALDACMWDFL